jgi:hypothetical protein
MLPHYAFNYLPSGSIRSSAWRFNLLLKTTFQSRRTGTLRLETYGLLECSKLRVLQKCYHPIQFLSFIYEEDNIYCCFFLCSRASFVISLWNVKVTL